MKKSVEAEIFDLFILNAKSLVFSFTWQKQK